MFKQIMFATSAEPSCDHAAKVAFDLAKKFQASLELFHVLGEPTRGFGQYVHDSRTGERELLSDDYQAWVVDELKTTYELQLKKQPETTIETAAGATHSEILRRAFKVGPDLIVMGAQEADEEGAKSAYAGSTVQRVAKAARCPVLIVARPCETCWGYFANIVFGTDFSKASMHAFDTALALAETIGTKLYIFHALELGSAGPITDQRHVEDRISGAKKKIEALYVSKMGSFDNYQVEVWEGTPFVEICKFARQNYADLIIMSHHAREIDADKANLGATMEQVVMRSVCPVMSVNHPPRK